MDLYYDRQGKPYKSKGIKAVLQWGKDFEDAKKKIVKQTTLKNGLFISTVWLGMDHNLGMSNKPLIFETMVFDTNRKETYKLGKIQHTTIGEDLDQERYSTEDQAVEGHKKMVLKYIRYKSPKKKAKLTWKL